MSITLKGQPLNQRQLDAIVGPLNDHMQGKTNTPEEFEQACVKALEAAGCPLGYDTGFKDCMSLEQRAQNWIVNGRVGSSSRTIWAHMMGATESRKSYPHDPDDLNRCLLLLDLIPEWAPRMAEMAQHGPQWKGLAERWDEITDCFIAEAGLDWCKASGAPKTYRLMRDILEAA